jgi:hypothetical protein
VIGRRNLAVDHEIAKSPNDSIFDRGFDAGDFFVDQPLG